MNNDIERQRIPSPLIGLLGEVFSNEYTHTQINNLFEYADAPTIEHGGNKVQKTMDWLKACNNQSENHWKFWVHCSRNFLKKVLLIMIRQCHGVKRLKAPKN